jgi:hypothetical protein
LVDTPFHDPVVGDVIEIEVIDLRHPLFGRRFPLVSVNRLRAMDGGYVLVAYQGRMRLKLPLAATSLTPRRMMDGEWSKLTVEAVREFVTLAEDSGVVACSSDPNASGGARPKRCDTKSPRMSPRSSRR